MGFARLAETSIRNMRGQKEGDKLGALDKILASSIGGALATWNQPIEVVRVEVCLPAVNNRLVTPICIACRCNRCLKTLPPQRTDPPSLRS